MKIYEFNSKILPGGELEYPNNIKEKLLPNQEVKVIILVKENSVTENSEEENWSRLAVKTFFSDYSEEDEIYNQI